MTHNVFVEEVESGGQDKYRWSCSCRRSGTPVTAKWYAEALGEKHRKRFTPKPQGHKALRDLLNLNGD